MIQISDLVLFNGHRRIWCVSDDGEWVYEFWFFPSGYTETYSKALV